MTDLIVQRVIFPTDPSRYPLYFRLKKCWFQGRAPTLLDRRSATLRQGTWFTTNTYFNSFFECYWRHYTNLGRLILRVRVSGRGTVELRRRSVENGDVLLRSLDFDGAEQVLELEVAPPQLHLRQSGSVYFDIVADAEPTTLHQADWIARDAAVRPVRILAGYCSFNREPYVLNNLNVLGADPAVTNCLHRILVVDQGTRQIQDHAEFPNIPPAVRGKLALIKQDNFGGAGGFTRIVLEALALKDATHVLLMDDDADLEPESVFRTFNFLALAKEELAVGGHMLNLLRPNQVVEAGGVVLPRKLACASPYDDLRVDVPANLAPFLEVRHVHYNAWWFFAFPLAVVDRVGLPLPVFIHMDDAEFGYRMTKSGVPSVAMPGVAVWHQPNCLKQGGWLSYYDRRNWFLAAAIHFPPSGFKLATLFLARLFYHLLRLEYFEAWMLCEAASDYCRGPEIITRRPTEIHQRLIAAQKQFGDPTLSRKLCLPQVHQAKGTKSWKLLPRFLMGLLYHLFHRSPSPAALPDHAVVEAQWAASPANDVIIVDYSYAENYVLRTRSWSKFVCFLAKGINTATRLLFRQKATVAKWQEAKDTLGSPAFWQDYLGLDGQAALDNASPRIDDKNRSTPNDAKAA